MFVERWRYGGILHADGTGGGDSYCGDVVFGIRVQKEEGGMVGAGAGSVGRDDSRCS